MKTVTPLNSFDPVYVAEPEYVQVLRRKNKAHRKSIREMQRKIRDQRLTIYELVDELERLDMSHARLEKALAEALSRQERPHR